MTTTNQAFIKAFARAEAPRDFQHGPSGDASAQSAAPSNGFWPHSNFGRPAVAPRIESTRSGAQTQSAPRPHVQFPADIRIDTDDRRHTRVDGRIEYEAARGDIAIELANERRPLSEFTATDNETALRAAYEVDQFAWPPLCEQLAHASAVELDALSNRIIRFAQSGGSVISVMGNAPSVGCTTATLTLARRIASTGARLVLVDGSFESPTLAARLGLAPAQGWDDAILGEIPLADAMIQSVADEIALAAIRRSTVDEPALSLLQSSTAASIIDQFRAAFDVVLFDAGAPLDPNDRDRLDLEILSTLGVDGAVVVTDSGESPSSIDLRLEKELVARRVTLLGAIRNFVQ